MARLPGWLVIEPPYKGRLSDDGKSAVFTVRIRRWHPTFLWLVFQMVVLKRDPLTKKADR